MAHSMDLNNNKFSQLVPLLNYRKHVRRIHSFVCWIFQGADPDGQDPEGKKLMDTVKDDKIKSMLKNA